MILTTLFVVWSLVSGCRSTFPASAFFFMHVHFTTMNCNFYSSFLLFSFYDILEDRVPTGLVAEYRSLLDECSQCFQQFSVLRSSLSTDSDSELDNVSMVEGLKLCEQLERFKRKLHIIENPLLR